MSIEAVLLTSVIDDLENRDVAVTDIPGAYFTTDIDKEVYMVLEGKLAKMMVIIVPEVYRVYITTSKNGKPTLYVKLKSTVWISSQCSADLKEIKWGNGQRRIRVKSVCRVCRK